MDERVERALRQWPQVPDVHGWLSLDRRGNWRLRGETISNPNLIGFIARNYLRLDSGSYAFQNGPQRVHVALEATPWIARLHRPLQAQLRFVDHTGAALDAIEAVYLDEDAQLLLATPGGPALVDDRELLELLGFFCDAQGSALDDATLNTAFAAPEAQQLHLAIHGQARPVQSLSGTISLEQHFGFRAVASPRPD